MNGMWGFFDPDAEERECGCLVDEPHLPSCGFYDPDEDGEHDGCIGCGKCDPLMTGDDEEMDGAEPDLTNP